MSNAILVNENATDPKNLLLNEDCSLHKVCSSIYRIVIDHKLSKWLVKVYKHRRDAKYESSTLLTLSSVKNVPKVLTFNISKEFSYVILSREKGIDLDNHVSKYGTFNEKELREIIKKILKILSEVHYLGVIHQDIKPENIIYDKKSDRLSIIDFEEKTTDLFSSPEQIRGDHLTEKSDIWSLGITCYYLLEDDVPFEKNSDIIKNRIVYPKHWSEGLKEFMDCLLDKDPIGRFSSRDAYNHAWLWD